MKNAIRLLIMFGVVAAIGCSQQETSQVTDTLSATGSQYLVDTEPDNSKPVGDARESAKDGESVTLLGHIGGSSKPFIEGIAAFTIVDPKVPYCSPEEGCPMPWDYCCTQNEVKNNIATVKVMNSDGKPVGEDARNLLGVKELSLVIVEGTAKRDNQGNLSVLASKVFVKKR